MDVSKLAALSACSVIVATTWYVSAKLLMDQQVTLPDRGVKHIYTQLYKSTTKVTAVESEHLNSDFLQAAQWIGRDKEYFSAKMPDDFVPIFGETYLFIRAQSPVTCGQVKFDRHLIRWSAFISSRRADVALLEGDRQLSDQEFQDVYQRVCL